MSSGARRRPDLHKFRGPVGRLISAAAASAASALRRRPLFRRLCVQRPTPSTSSGDVVFRRTLHAPRVLPRPAHPAYRRCRRRPSVRPTCRCKAEKSSEAAAARPRGGWRTCPAHECYAALLICRRGKSSKSKMKECNKALIFALPSSVLPPSPARPAACRAQVGQRSKLSRGQPRSAHDCSRHVVGACGGASDRRPVAASRAHDALWREVERAACRD